MARSPLSSLALAASTSMARTRAAPSPALVTLTLAASAVSSWGATSSSPWPAAADGGAQRRRRGGGGRRRQPGAPRRLRGRDRRHRQRREAGATRPCRWRSCQGRQDPGRHPRGAREVGRPSARGEREGLRHLRFGGEEDSTSSSTRASRSSSIDLNKAGEQMKGFTPPAPRPSTGAPRRRSAAPKVTKTGKYDTVAGYKCENWDVATDIARGPPASRREGFSWLSLPMSGPQRRAHRAPLDGRSCSTASTSRCASSATGPTA